MTELCIRRSARLIFFLNHEFGKFKIPYSVIMWDGQIRERKIPAFIDREVEGALVTELITAQATSNNINREVLAIVGKEVVGR